jgi:hypothetical protein
MYRRVSKSLGRRKMEPRDLLVVWARESVGSFACAAQMGQMDAVPRRYSARVQSERLCFYQLIVTSLAWSALRRCKILQPFNAMISN